MEIKEQLKQILETTNISGPHSDGLHSEVRAFGVPKLNSHQIAQLTQLGSLSIKRSGAGMSVTLITKKQHPNESN